MNALSRLIAAHRTVVCVGSGGVGKTTTSAVIALHAAILGRRALVLTIDPAKRLANSLGLEGIGNEATRIDLEPYYGAAKRPRGELWAMMLDMKTSFDNVVQRNTTPADAERILCNKYYKSFSSSLSGTQEYSAIERLWELSETGKYDLIVLDTPPTRHALDFLDAPTRLYSALDSSAMQWLYKPALASGKVGLGLVKLGARGIRKTLGKLTGSQMLDDLTVFLEGLAPLFEGLKERAGRVDALLHDSATAFVVVTSPDPLTVSEALYFDDRLAQERLRLAAFVVNRVRTPVRGADASAAELRDASALVAALRRLPGAARHDDAELQRLAPKVLRNADDFDGLAAADQVALQRLRDNRKGGSVEAVPVFPIPLYSTDVYSMTGLDRVRRDLFGDTTAEAARSGSRPPTTPGGKKR